MTGVMAPEAHLAPTYQKPATAHLPTSSSLRLFCLIAIMALSVAAYSSLLRRGGALPRVGKSLGEDHTNTEGEEWAKEYA